MDYISTKFLLKDYPSILANCEKLMDSYRGISSKANLIKKENSGNFLLSKEACFDLTAELKYPPLFLVRAKELFEILKEPILEVSDSEELIKISTGFKTKSGTYRLLTLTIGEKHFTLASDIERVFGFEPKKNKLCEITKSEESLKTVIDTLNSSVKEIGFLNGDSLWVPHRNAFEELLTQTPKKHFTSNFYSGAIFFGNNLKEKDIKLITEKVTIELQQRAEFHSNTARSLNLKIQEIESSVLPQLKNLKASFVYSKADLSAIFNKLIPNRVIEEIMVAMGLDYSQNGKIKNFKKVENLKKKVFSYLFSHKETSYVVPFLPVSEIIVLNESIVPGSFLRLKVCDDLLEVLGKTREQLEHLYTPSNPTV